MKKLPLKFKLSELLLLVFELNLFAAGILMVYAAVTGSNTALYIPARALAGMLPAVMTVGFAMWLVYRLRCLRQAEKRSWALVGAWCLGIVALSFGAAVGKLNMIHMSEPVQATISAAINSPLLKRAGLGSLLAFMSIGFIFSITFVYEAAKGPFVPKDTSGQLHAQLSQLGQKIVHDWPESLVPKIDAFLECDEVDEAIEFYQAKTRCSEDEAAIVIADWPEQRLMLQIDLLNTTVAENAERRKAKKSRQATTPEPAPTA